MKKLITSMLIVAALTTSCKQSNSNGQCVGLMDKENKSPEHQYDISLWNVFLAVIFSETIVVPIVVVGYMLECPEE
jgi:major membrane immunogen (membrane-anchored lipoprotein)